MQWSRFHRHDIEQVTVLFSFHFGCFVCFVYYSPSSTTTATGHSSLWRLNPPDDWVVVWTIKVKANKQMKLSLSLSLRFDSGKRRQGPLKTRLSLEQALRDTQRLVNADSPLTQIVGPRNFPGLWTRSCLGMFPSFPMSSRDMFGLWMVIANMVSTHTPSPPTFSMIKNGLQVYKLGNNNAPFLLANIGWKKKKKKLVFSWSLSQPSVYVLYLALVCSSHLFVFFWVLLV